MAVSAATRAAVAARAGGLCEYCRCPAAFCPAPFCLDHIEPRSRAGSDDPDNLAWACHGCNGSKYARTTVVDPDSGQAVPLYHPRRHRWRDHFAWSADGLDILGLTPTGRATVLALDLNRDNVTNLRRVLVIVGRHPPPEA